ncbi:hypothetical protein LXM25_23640 [Dyadobacter sp. LJ53]|uniref:hypothetical protein n=1 Tax=Dyadobacter chenwenxiniae TaxID=2906456 RepID=UPI001F306073|nr:hypothetical protein [Dyadobacter chenwenxiniae]MCF0053082.1 hypothetical protein [Dyadobacter chenwenxiniae]
MKKTIFTALAFVLSMCMVLAQNEKYTQAMTTNIHALNGLDKEKPDAKALQDIANRFERIAAAEPKEWLPKYYAARCNVILGFVGASLEEKDKYLEKAGALLKDAEAIAGKPNDEILVMQAFHSQIHLAADAANRWEADGAKFAEYITSAKKVNAENPRIYYLEGSSVFFTPEEFGGGKKPAKPFLEKASQKFAAFKPETSIHPDWGKAETEWMLAQTNQ